MQNAPPGQVLVSQAAQRLTGDTFRWELLPPLRVRGKSQPVTVFRLLNAQERHTIRLQEPKYALPMVGESIALTMRVGDRWSATRTLEDIAMLEAEIGEPEQALRAAGAAAASREAMRTPMPLPDHARLDVGLAPAREALGAKADAAWEEGRRLSMEQILDLVMAA